MKTNLYTIYERHPDFPDSFPVRKFTLTNGDLVPGDIIGQGNTLSAARSYIPVGLTRFVRAIGDHPTIVETWL